MTVVVISGCSLLPGVDIDVPSQPPAPAAFLMVEDFDSVEPGSLPDGWLIEGSGDHPDYPFVVAASDEEILANSGSRVLKVDRTAEQDVGLVTRRSIVHFDPLSDRAVISFWIYPTQSMRGLNFAINGDTPDSGKTSLGTNSSSTIFMGAYTSSGTPGVRVYNPESVSGTWTNGPELTLNTWNEVAFDINMNSGKFDLYLNGVISDSVQDFPFVKETVALTGIGFFFQATSGNETKEAPFYVDDLMITNCIDEFVLYCDL